MYPNYSRTESQILNLFTVGSEITYGGTKNIVILSGKPRPNKGECKTDVYLKLRNLTGLITEVKISIKQVNADFVANKISLKRAIEIFGNDAQNIITNSLLNIEHAFSNDEIIKFDSGGRAQDMRMTIGWRLDIMNKQSGRKSEELLLSQSQIEDIYAGNSLSQEKKHSKVKNIVVKNSGVANYFLEVKGNEFNLAQSVIDSLETIKDYSEGKKLFFACKAVNYRVKANKWDGDRPLAVYVDWKLIDNKIVSEIIFKSPLQFGANKVGNNLREILNELGIDKSNFNTLKKYLQ